MFISFSHFRWRDQKDQIQIICVSLLCSLCSLLSNPSSAFLFNTTSHAPISVENETRKAHSDQKRKEKKNDAKIIRLMEEYISNLKFAVTAAAVLMLPVLAVVPLLLLFLSVCSFSCSCPCPRPTIVVVFVLILIDACAYTQYNNIWKPNRWLLWLNSRRYSSWSRPKASIDTRLYNHAFPGNSHVDCVIVGIREGWKLGNVVGVNQQTRPILYSIPNPSNLTPHRNTKGVYIRMAKALCCCLRSFSSSDTYCFMSRTDDKLCLFYIKREGKNKENSQQSMIKECRPLELSQLVQFHMRIYCPQTDKHGNTDPIRRSRVITRVAIL